MIFQPKNILLIGATGQIGSHILSALLTARQEFNRIALFTSASTASKNATYLSDLRTKNQVEVIVGDITNEKDIRNAYNGIDTIISSLGRDALHQQIPLVTLASEHPDVKWILPSEYGTDIAYSAASAYEKPHQQKLKVRAFLEDSQKKGTLGVGYTYVVTGPFAEFYLRFAGPDERAGGWDVARRKGVLLEKGNRVSLTSMPDVGKLVLETLRRPDVAMNRALKVNSFTTTPALIQEEFERQTGGKAWTDVSETPLGQLRELETEAWEAGKPYATVLTLRRIWTEGGTLYDQRDNGLIGEPPMKTLEQLVAEEVKRA